MEQKTWLMLRVGLLIAVVIAAIAIAGHFTKAERRRYFEQQQPRKAVIVELTDKVIIVIMMTNPNLIRLSLYYIIVTGRQNQGSDIAKLSNSASWTVDISSADISKH